MRAHTRLILVIAATSLIGCGDKIRGTYSDAAGVTEYAFAGNGQVTIQVLGATVNAEYRIDDDRVLVSSAQGTVVLMLRDDRLYGPMGLELIRRAKITTGE